MIRDNLSQVVLFAYALQQQAQDTGQDAHQLLHEWINELGPKVALHIIHDFSFWARPNQLPPDGDWTVWLIMGGRGSGKTRPGAEWILQKEREGCQRMALVAETESDGRKIMVEGPSGILKCAPPRNRPEYHPEKRELIWPSGARADLFSGDSPDQIPGHAFDAAWADEVAKWKYPEEAYTHLDLALREGDDAQCVITTTPRPLAFLRNLRKDPGCVTVQAKTYDNAPHLDASYIKRIAQRYDGTEIGRQEIDGELLEDIRGALWTLSQINETRIRNPAAAPEYARIVIGVDPQGKEASNNIWIPDEDQGSETGIVVCGEGRDGRGYVLDDLSGDYNPNKWGQMVEAAYHQHGADRIVAEANNGGEMVRHTIYTVDPNLPVEIVRASEGKKARAEPVSALYEQGKVSHVGNFAKLEDEMTTYTGKGRSPNRLDALVWALTELFLRPKNDSMPHFDPRKHESPPRKTRLRGESEEHWADRSAVYIPE